MSSNGKLKEYFGEKVRRPFIYIIIFVILFLAVAAGSFMWFAPDKLKEKIFPSAGSKKDIYTFSDIEDPIAVSERLSKLEETHVEWTKIREDENMNGIYFITGDISEYAVYNADMNNLMNEGFSYLNFDHIWVDSSAENFYIVINIPGEKVDLRGYYVLVRNDSENYAGHAIFNCYEAKEVILDEAIFTGTLLAPYANVNYFNTYLYGQVYSASYSGNIAYCKSIPFSGYEAVIDGLEPVEFKTRAVREAVIKALAEIDPMKYNSYTYDSKIVRADLKKIKTLDLNSLAIVSLEDDMQYFTHVAGLSLRNASVKSLDFSIFDCLISLDISWSDIDFTDLSILPNLKSLSISGKNFDDFDLTKVPDLVYLECINCGITNESFKKIAAIGKLNTLVIADNDGLTKPDFSSLGALTQLDVSGLNLEELKISQYKTQLTYLKCSNCGITEIDLSGFVSLRTIEAYGFTKIDLTGVAAEQIRTFYRDEETQVILSEPETTPEPVSEPTPSPEPEAGEDQPKQTNIPEISPEPFEITE